MSTTNGTSPATCYKRAVRVMKGAGVASVLVLAGWVTPNGLPDSRYTMAAYFTTLLVAVGSGCVAMLASCHLAISKAFAAGFQTGQVAAGDQGAIARAESAAKRGETDPVLRLVE